MILQYSYIYILISLSWLHQMACACPSGCQCTHTGWGQRAFCRGGSLTDILASVTKDIQQLHISKATNLRVLRREDFKHLKGFPLTKIFLTECSIQEIQESVFSDLNSLLELSFSENNINVVSNEAFSGLQQLKRLDLSHNRISRLGTMLHKLVSLERLELTDNLLSNLEAGSFLALSNLVLLKLDGNQLQKIDGEIFKGLDHLEYLSLRMCHLFSIDSDLFNVLRRVVTLDLGENKLSAVPQSKDFIKLKFLKNLYLDKNEITTLFDSQFAGMALNKLSLSTNRIDKLTRKTFEYLEVRELDLSYNIINIREKLFVSAAQNVEVLDIAGNPLRRLPSDAFQSLHRLNYLNLSSCALEELTDNLFRDLNNLRSLDLSHNSLRYIPRDCVAVLNRLQVLSIQNNPWHCDCHIKSLRSWLQEPRSTSIMFCEHESQYGGSCRQIRCATPASYSNKQVLGLHTSDIAECREDDPASPLSVNTQIAIVIPCIVVSLILLILAICLWRRGRTREELRKVCVPVGQESSYLEDYEKKPSPFENSEIRSLNESDRSFVFRNYFQTMVSNPSRLSYPTISQRDVDSVYSSQPSLYSSCSRVPQQTVGIESTV